MPTYDSIISRSGSTALMPEDVAREIIQGAVEQSAVLTFARRLPNMNQKQRRMPVLSALPTAYFVDGDTGLKQTSEVAWANKYIDAEELAVIVPIPEAVLDDADYDIWGEVRPRVAEAIGVAIDQAVLFGTNAPASWPDDVLAAATAAANVVDESTQIAASEDLYDMILGAAGVVSKVEADGFMVNGHIAAMSMRGKLRGLRESTGGLIFTTSMQGSNSYLLDGSPIAFPRNGAINPATALLFSGDWSQLVYAVRQDITYKVLTEAVLQDGAGNIVYNLAQQDMVALRAVMRLGWQVPNPINRMQQTEANRYPIAVLVP
jgi:HK97 family phage major capsid protein